MDIILAILAVGTLNLACFFVGAKVGQKVVKGEPVALPSLDLAEKKREREDRKAAREEQSRLDTILRNVDNYNGTELGQEDVPRG